MSHILSLGAINKLTGEYVYPKIANKKDEYICSECNKDLILCQGKIKVHHFRHKVDNVNPCHHYSNPTETQIHKDAKILLKNLLERKIPISFIRNCCLCKINEEFEIPEISKTSTIQLEYRFEYNGVKFADVAYIDDDDIVCIFEICNTHKTCSENRPEPWFEINAETLIKIANDNSLTSLQIPCIRCEKCNDCIEKEKGNIIKKNKALDILYNWFQSGIEISPFKYDYASFAGLEKNVKSEFTDEMFDLILYVEPSEKYQRYFIRLIYNYSNYYFTKERDYAESYKSIYYLDIDWILSQTEIPKTINYIASLDCYNHNEFNKYCNNCESGWPFWVKRINNKVIHIGCSGCGYNPNTEIIKCEMCSNDTPLWVMETNKININICKNCDIYLFSSGNIYLNVSFNLKDEVKKLGANWDNKYKKWFINKNNKNIDMILQKWKRIW
jgi:hypothetical protein